LTLQFRTWGKQTDDKAGVEFFDGPGRREAARFRFRHKSFADLFGDVHPAEPESLCNGATHGSFAIQNHIDQNAIKAVVLRKSGLTTFTLDCGPQHANNVVFVKHKRAAAQIAGNQHT
jgi:hypothetical protein